MDGVSIAASLVGLGTAGCQIAIKMYTLASQISTASQRITAVSNDISMTSGVLKELGEFIAKDTGDEGIAIFSQSGLETTKSSAAVCESIFNEIEGAAKEASEQLRTREKTRDRIVGKIKLSRSEKVKWPFLQPSIESLRIDLREAKGTLILMLQVLNLAWSQKMAVMHQATSMSIVEQREIYRAILAIKKQTQGDCSTRANSVTQKVSSDGASRAISPPSPASCTVVRRMSSSSENRTTLSASSTDPAAAPDLSPQTFAAKPGPHASPPVLLQTSEKDATLETSKLGSRQSLDEIEIELNSVDCKSDQLSAEGNKTPQLHVDDINQNEAYRELEFFAIKALIQDRTDQYSTISLIFQNHKLPLQQVDIQEKLSKSKEGGLRPVADGYLDLFEHEREAIDDLVEKSSWRPSLLLLKRTFTDMNCRGILFKSVPELHFIIGRPTIEYQNEGLSGPPPGRMPKMMFVRDQRPSIRSSGRTRSSHSLQNPHTLDHGHDGAMVHIQKEMNVVNLSKPTYIKVHRKHLDTDTLEEYGLPWEWDDVSLATPPYNLRKQFTDTVYGKDSDYMIIKRYISENDRDKLFDHTRKMRRDNQIKQNEEAIARLEDAGVELDGTPYLVEREEAELERTGLLHKHAGLEDALEESEQSEDSDESIIMSDESINDEEAEKAVKELLGKYTTLGSVAGGIA
ncbi:MAG: hypothetical protein Q9180_004022 [Flavoplaca navasiana]